MTDTKIFRLSSVLPPGLSDDKKILSLAKAVDAELEKLTAQIEKVLHLPRLDKLPSDVLDHLATQFHVDFYSDDYPPEIKRKMILESVFVHRIKGTPAAVEKFLSGVMKNVIVEENWEYGGEPYFFRLKTGGAKITIDTETEFFRLINAAKNLRSWLERIEFDLTSGEVDLHLYFAAGILGGGRELIEHDVRSGLISKTYHTIAEKFAGREVIQNAEVESIISKTYQTLCLAVGGKIIIGADYSGDLDESGDFARLCRERWLAFKRNPVIEFYHHHNHEFDGEISDDEPEIFPTEKDFLRLYYGFERGKIRYETIRHPRENLTAADINSLGNFAANNKIILNSAGVPTKGIIRALLISKTYEAIL